MPDQPLTRFRLLVHYDGGALHGWQVQPDVPTVQGELEAVLKRISGAHRTVLGSGRTDTGVHATGQVAVADLPASWSAPRLRAALNGLLPDAIWIEAVEAVPSGFHPRFDARARTYRYRLGTSPAAASPFHRRWCWALGETLSWSAVEEATALLVGHHSFRAFAKAGQEERGHRCEVHAAGWEDWPDLGRVFTITANRYLHHMVRYLVGTLVDVGLDRRPVSDLRTLLDGSDPELVTSPPAPPQGLFLTRVDY
ncbi:MAG TPA: tRNA pseudouridine(38-40) synthase TruA [Longimicrobiales bacterium]|nr:tRNA pseudouridine(38-40) synthase TruA [Longimicrobiales bacterium]